MYDSRDIGVKTGDWGDEMLALFEVLDKREAIGLAGRDFEGLDGVVRPSRLDDQNPSHFSSSISS